MLGVEISHKLDIDQFRRKEYEKPKVRLFHVKRQARAHTPRNVCVFLCVGGSVYAGASVGVSLSVCVCKCVSV